VLAVGFVEEVLLCMAINSEYLDLSSVLFKKTTNRSQRLHLNKENVEREREKQ
jgi:hypothetical protein